jgi:hypothetical protein
MPPRRVTTLERARVDASAAQLERRTGARGLIRSGAVGNNQPIGVIGSPGGQLIG